MALLGELGKSLRGQLALGNEEDILDLLFGRLMSGDLSDSFGSTPAYPQQFGSTPAYPQQFGSTAPSTGTSLAAGTGYSGQPLDLANNPFRVAPVQGMGLEDFGGDWHAPRVGHLHQGTDIFARSGTPVYAPFGGVYDSGSGGIAGNYVHVTNPQRGRMFGAHLSAFPEGLESGSKVRPGDLIGFVGNTGNAISTPSHLHFEYRRPGADTSIDPIGLLEAILKTPPPKPTPRRIGSSSQQR